MSKQFENGLFIFRRDFRIIDNNALNLLSQYCKNIYTIFIFTPEQVGSGNKFKSDNSVEFMIESLTDLANTISKQGGHLSFFYGHNDSVVQDCIKSLNIQLVSFNLDITPYAKERDAKIIKICEKMKTYVIYDYDYYLHEPGKILNVSGDSYKKFTPYYHAATKLKVQEPTKAKQLHLKKSDAHIPNKITLEQAMKKFTKINPDILVHGGRTNAIKQIKQASKNLKHYSSTHNTLTYSTSELSAYIKFGCLSIREVYKTFKSNHNFVRQLYWRDFYAQILDNYPQVLKRSMNPKYDKIRWQYNERWFKAWTTGTTGFPVIDAGMRQMNQTGYMHNRARLITASFLVKTLLINWRKGEQYYAQTLTDYDVANNNGNWLWVMGGGADSQPWFRIFNPWRQQEENDVNCEYIKQWIPELKDVPNKAIHNWNTEWNNYKDIDYPKPICDYTEQKEKALKMYKDALY